MVRKDIHCGSLELGLDAMISLPRFLFLCSCSADAVRGRDQPMPYGGIEQEYPPESTFAELYDLDEQIGKGGFSTVRIAYERKMHQKVAVKIAKRSQLQDDISAWEQEFQILKSLHHPHIVKAYGLFHEAENLYMVLEFMPGGELFDRIVERKKYTEEVAQNAFRQILLAIEHFHSHDIIHRDLKPENLLLTSREDDSNLKVADFGLARFVRAGDELVSRAGTPDYIAPEVVRSKPLTKAVDMWAAGVILFILLGGYSPFHKKDKAAMFQRISEGHYTFHPQRWSTVSDCAKDLVSKLLQVDVDTRLTASQALQHSWLSREVVHHDISGNLPPMRQFNARRKLRGGIHAVMVANRMKKLVSSDRHGSEDVLCEEDPTEV